MSKESAEKWVKFIHNDQKTGQQLLAIKDGDWDAYFKVVHQNGYDFDQDELSHAWAKEFGSGLLSEKELEKVAGGLSEDPPRTVALGIRG